jgi:hypothetical protein
MASDYGSGRARSVGGTSTKRAVKRTRKVTEGYKEKTAKTHQEVRDDSRHPDKGKKVNKK